MSIWPSVSRSTSAASEIVAFLASMTGMMSADRVGNSLTSVQFKLQFSGLVEPKEVVV